jgi:hypothetical protein
MAKLFQDRISNFPNRYKITRTDGTSEYVTLERADVPIRIGTPLNAATFNEMVGMQGLENMLADGPMILTMGEDYQYGDDLPVPANPGRIFFKRVVD